MFRIVSIWFISVLGLMTAGNCLERAKGVLSFHASKLWSPSSDDFEFICGRIWLIAHSVAQRLQPMMLSDVLPLTPDDNMIYDEEENFDMASADLENVDSSTLHSEPLSPHQDRFVLDF